MDFDFQRPEGIEGSYRLAIVVILFLILVVTLSYQPSLKKQV